MSAHRRTHPLLPGRDAEALDPRHLGRPVHLLPRFTESVHEDLTAALKSGINRRYRSALEPGDAKFARVDPPANAGRWLSFAGTEGRIGFAIERPLLLAVLECRYGAPADSTPDAAGRETATEERLARAFGLQLVERLATLIDPQPQKFRVETRPPAPGAWTLAIQIEETRRKVTGSLCFSFDNAWMTRILKSLTPQRVAVKESPDAAAALAQRLSLRLVGRLVDKQILLGDLLDLGVGDVIPVTVGATDVLIDESRVFRATVAERKGKLCLTSFEDVD